MAKKSIKTLPVVKAFAEYFIRKGKKDSKLKRADYVSVNVEYSTRGLVYVWFHGPDKVVGYITYLADGKKRDG